MFQDPNVVSKIFNKKWGRGIKNGIPVTSNEFDTENPGMENGVIPEKGPSDPYAKGVVHTQSILMSWNKEKFVPASEGLNKSEHTPNDLLDGENHYEIYLPIDNNKASSQNFVVKRLKTKPEASGPNAKQIYVTLICTHFKSKYDGFFDRAKFAQEISKFIEKEKEKDINRKVKRNESFVIMGDLNGPRHEMSVNFLKRIIKPKRHSQTAP